MKKLFCAIVCALPLVSVYAASPVTAENVSRFASIVSQDGNPVAAAPVTFHPNEVDLSYGRVSLYAVAFGFSGIMVSALSIGTAVIDELSSSGAVGFGYYHWFNPRFALGGEAAFENIRLGFKTGSDGTKMDPTSNNLLHIMPSIKGRWVFKEHFGFYSKASLGPALLLSGREVETDSEGNKTVTPAKLGVSVAFQLSPIGLEFGSTSWRGFAELGFGVQGMVLAGVRYSF